MDDSSHRPFLATQRLLETTVRKESCKLVAFPCFSFHQHLLVSPVPFPQVLTHFCSKIKCSLQIQKLNSTYGREASFFRGHWWSCNVSWTVTKYMQNFRSFVSSFVLLNSSAVHFHICSPEICFSFPDSVPPSTSLNAFSTWNKILWVLILLLLFRYWNGILSNI